MDGSIRRRRLLGAGAALVLAAGVPTLGATAAHAESDQFDVLRAAWSDLLTGGARVEPADPDYAAALADLDAAADTAIALYDRSATPAGVYTDLPFGPVENASLSYYRIRDTALAWATNGSRHHQDANTAAESVAALALLGDRFYHPSAAQVGNWYHWEIACPQALQNACALLGPALPAADLARYLDTTRHFAGDPTRQQQGTVVTTGANRADLCQIAILRGILARDPAQIALGRDKLSDLFPYVTSGDGFYADGGYIQHGTIPYNGHYAYVLLGDLSQLAALLTGSSWPITDPGFATVLDSVELTFAPFQRDGLMMDVVRGRFLSRQGETDHDAGHFVTEAVLRLVPAGSPAQQRSWKALAKGWIQNESYARITEGATPQRIALVKSVLDDHRVRAADEPLGHVQLPSVERVVHSRPGWAWTVGLSSSRIARLEALNGENQRGWHTGDGATYLYTDDNGHYTDAYWPTVDATRLPGTTADRRPLAAGAGNATLPPTTWSGGAVLAGRYGAVGLDLVPFGSPLRAKKSWFCLDDGVVALGAGITGSGGFAVETTVEQRNLHAAGRNRLTVDGAVQPGADGWHGEFTGARWAHLEGVAGYRFLGRDAPLRALRESRTGAWADIDNGPSTGGTYDPHTNRYATLWLDHGVDPAGADYAYLLLPGASVRRTAAHPGVELLANTGAVQAIRTRQQGAELTAANFFAPGTAGGITVDGPASVLGRRFEERFELAVADPTGTLRTLTLHLEGHYRRLTSADPGVQLVGPSQLVIDLTLGRPRSSRSLTLVR